MQLLQVALQVRLVVLPCHSVHPGCGTALERQERLPILLMALIIGFVLSLAATVIAGTYFSYDKPYGRWYA